MEGRIRLLTTTKVITMRKIEARIIEALRAQLEFKSGNTCVELLPLAGQVSIMDCDLVSRVYLHGNLIAQYNRALNELIIEDGGWESVTTKSRLNALISEFAPAYRIVQRDWQWYIDDLSNDEESMIPWTGAAVFRAGSLKETV